jgi:hypothetical protein
VLPKFTNIYRFYGSGPTVSIQWDFCLPWPAKIIVGNSTPKKRRPFEKYLPVTWNVPTKTRKVKVKNRRNDNLAVILILELVN